MMETGEKETIDHDALFKRLLKTFFIEFLQLFIPSLVAHIVPESVTFLDKELFADMLGKERREADIVARARFQDSDIYFLLLCEPMSYAQSNFPARLLLYLALLYKEYGLIVYPIVVYSYDEPLRQEPDSLNFVFPNKTVLTFDYDVVQLNRLYWEDFMDAPNPIASALMCRMKFDAKDKVKVKAACMKSMLSLNLNFEEMSLIAGFVNSYIKLTPDESLEFVRATADIAPSLREKKMLLTNYWQEKGLEEGLEKGLEEGLEKGLEIGATTTLQKMTLRHAVRCVGSISEELEGMIRRLSLTDLEDLQEALYDFTQIGEIENWLNKRIAKARE